MAWPVAVPQSYGVHVVKYGLIKVKDRSADLSMALAELTGTRVLVGFPADGDDKQGAGAIGPNERQPEEGESTALNNATIGYLMNTGMPEKNVPAREFMATGILAGQKRMDSLMQQTGKKALSGDTDAVERGYISIGLVAQSSIKNTINAGIPPPLADSTLRARLRRHKGRKGERKELEARAAGAAPGLENVKPLVDTGQLRNAVSFVLRRGRKRG